MQGKQERIHYLDWLRVLAVLGVFYAHSGYIFTMFYWHSRSDDRSVGMLVIQNFISQWGMSLFFLLSGASTWFALRSRTGRQFISERFKRLIIPFVVGCILLSPPEAYFEALSRSLYHGPFIQFYPYFFRSISPSWHLLWLRYYGYHLWFLVFLFTFSAIALPLFFSFKNLSIQYFIARLAAFTEMPGGIFVFVLPITLIQVALRPIFPLYEDWADFFGWLIFFLYGYILFSNPRFGYAIEKQGKIALLTGIICALVIVALWFAGFVRAWETTPNYSAAYLLYQFLRSLTSWAWIIFALYVGKRYLNFSNKVLIYAEEIVLPFYLLHYLVVTILTFYLVQLNIMMVATFLLSSTSSLVVTTVLCDLLVRRNNVTPWLFGMKPQRHGA